MRSFGRHLTYANVMSSIAVFAVLATGGAYAADTIFSTDIVDGEVKVADIGPGAVGSSEVINNALTSSDIGAGAVGTSEITNGTVGNLDLASDAVFGSNVAPESLDGGDVAPNGLSGADIDEASLGTVPQAQSAQTLGSLSAADVDTVGFGPATVGCDPSSATFANCGTSALGPSPSVSSDILVNAAGFWSAPGAGAEGGECRLVLDGTVVSEGIRFGQDGNVHVSVDTAGSLALTHVFHNVAPGAHQIRLQCRETNANMIVHTVRMTAVRVGD